MDAKLKNSKHMTANLGDVKKQPFYCLISTAVLTCVSNKLYIEYYHKKYGIGCGNIFFGFP
jgi:hypothetical protein